MSVITEIIGGVASGGLMNVFGAVSGLIGGWLAKIEQRKMLELVNTHEEKMADFDLKRDQIAYDHTLAVIDKQIDQAEAEGAIADDLRSADAFIESMKGESNLTGFGAAVKSAVRPLITGVLLWCTWVIYDQLNTLVGGLEGLDAELLQQLFIYVVQAILFLTITAVAWWFASRGDRAVKSIKGMMS